MCGFVGVLDKSGDARGWAAKLTAATDALAHRGPDDRGEWVQGPLCLGFRRLSILDLTAAGHQPMLSADGDWAVVFNGEIYNFIELRRELQAKGVVFRSDSDTEVLVEALATWGVQCLDRCNGMWAILAWHRPTRTLHACRDPWGIKPLFVTEQPGWIGFASEIKALTVLGAELGGVDPVAARRFLDDAALDVDARTMFAGVRRLAPGVLYRYRDGHALAPQPYGDGTALVDVPRFGEGDAGEAAYIDAFRTAFLDAVRLRLRADVDIGTCLSGGLDSTAISCAAARILAVVAQANSGGERVTACRHAFTAQLREFDESRYIEAVIAQTGAKWHVTVAEDSLIQAKAPGFFAAHDEPVHSLTPMAGYLVMGLAAEAGVHVLLNGQGADELLAGYTSTQLPYLRSLLREEGVGYAARQAIAEAGNVPDGLKLLARAQAGRTMRSLPSRFEAALRRHRFAARAGDGFVAQAGPLGPAHIPERPPSDALQAALDDSTRHSPLPLFLRIEDTNSSAFSIEARLPFLDPAVVAMARAAPARLLRRDGSNKYLLRRILPGLVPDIVWQRQDKMGFPVPYARWLRGPLRAMMTDTLSETRLRRRGWYAAAPIARAVDVFLHGSGPMPMPLLRVFLLERWARDHLPGS